MWYLSHSLTPYSIIIPTRTTTTSLNEGTFALFASNHRERDRERERERKKEKERERETETETEKFYDLTSLMATFSLLYRFFPILSSPKLPQPIFLPTRKLGPTMKTAPAPSREGPPLSSPPPSLPPRALGRLPPFRSRFIAMWYLSHSLTPYSIIIPTRTTTTSLNEGTFALFAE
eukprot:sb/3471906/